jgi:hypothetical protein
MGNKSIFRAAHIELVAFKINLIIDLFKTLAFSTMQNKLVVQKSDPTTKIHF